MKYRFLRYPEGRSKAVTFSYDDGCRHDLRLAKTLSKYGIKCTFNLSSGSILKNKSDWNLTKEEILEYVIKAGHEIAVHGEWHKAPGLVSAIDGIQDVLNCRSDLEKAFDMIIRGMAYPDSGITNFSNQANYENIKHYLKDLGIVYSRTLQGDNNLFRLPDDWYAWMPTAHHTNPKVLEYADEFIAIDTDKQYCSKQYPRLFYLWGHSFEFANNNNWELLDAICEKLSGKEDIWYATNIEIYDYVKAYDSLVFSADGSRIYNPTLITVWFDIDGTVYNIKSGETLVL